MNQFLFQEYGSVVSQPKTIDLCVLVGSIRADSFSLRIANLIASFALSAGQVCEVVDPRALNLGIPHHPADQGQAATNASDLQARIKNTTAVIFVSPEYDGSYSAVSKVLIEHLGYPSALSGKFISIIGVASGRIGADRAIDHLRGVLIHIGGIVLTNYLSVAEVHKMFSSNGEVDRSFANSLESLTSELIQASKKASRV